MSSHAEQATVGAWVVRHERTADHDAVRPVQSLAFGDDDRIPRLVDSLRLAPAPLPPVSLVATVDGRAVGHVMLSAGRLDAPRRLVDVLTLSPLGVRPEFQRRGIGTQLLARALAGADGEGVPLVFLEGSPRYYGKRGFRQAAGLGFRSPSLRISIEALQVATLPLYEPWMTGT